MIDAIERKSSKNDSSISVLRPHKTCEPSSPSTSRNVKGGLPIAPEGAVTAAVDFINTPSHVFGVGVGTGPIAKSLQSARIQLKGYRSHSRSPRHKFDKLAIPALPSENMTPRPPKSGKDPLSPQRQHQFQRNPSADVVLQSSSVCKDGGDLGGNGITMKLKQLANTKVPSALLELLLLVVDDDSVRRELISVRSLLKHC